MKTTAQFARFLVAGGIGLLVLLVATYVFTEVFHMWYFWSYTIATLLSWSSIFLMNSFFTFAGHNKERYGKKYLSFLGMYLGTFIINASLVYLFTSQVGLYYLLSITIATAITTVITFTLSRMFIFTYGTQD